jgi:hypothetical protein
MDVVLHLEIVTITMLEPLQEDQEMQGDSQEKRDSFLITRY